jgi:prophage regulatory protein
MTDRLLRLPEVTKITGLSPSTIWRQEKEGRFPHRRHISVRAVAWLMSEVEAWITARWGETIEAEVGRLD